MSLLIGFLTLILVTNCLLLLLLILVQLPKKEAGIGTAFGGGATDALFGAGSGNVLTKLTKYSSGIFLGLALVLSVLLVRQNNDRSRGLQQELLRKAAAPGYVKPPPAGAAATINPSVGTNALMLNLTNLSVPAATTPAPAKPANGAQTLPEAPANPPPK